MNQDPKPGFWKRFFLAFIKTILTAVILAALIWGGLAAIIELQRSFDSVTVRVDRNKRDIETLRGQMVAASEESPDRQDIEGLRATTEELTNELNTLREEMAGDLERQQEMLTALEENINAVTEANQTVTNLGETAREETAALASALVAIQGDFNDTNSRIDALGGEIDELRAENTTLDADLAELNQSVISTTVAAAEMETFQQTLALFHVWELVARARLRLVENNLGLATADVERAFRALDEILIADLGENEEALKVVQTRLAFTFTSLTDNPDVAARDLESAWDELDRILTDRLFPDLATRVETEAIQPVVEEITPTPETTAVPAPTATPSP